MYKVQVWYVGVSIERTEKGIELLLNEGYTLQPVTAGGNLIFVKKIK